MVEQFSIGHHGGVLEVFSKAACHEVYMYPGDILMREHLGFEILGVSLDDADKFLLLFFDLCSLSLYALAHPCVLEIVELVMWPESYVVYLFGQIFEQMVPS